MSMLSPEIEKALAETRVAGTARCRLTTSAGTMIGELDFANDDRTGNPKSPHPVTGEALEAINVGPRSYWTTSEGWREMRLKGQEAPGLGYLASVLEPLADTGWSVERRKVRMPLLRQ